MEVGIVPAQQVHRNTQESWGDVTASYNKSVQAHSVLRRGVINTCGGGGVSWLCMAFNIIYRFPISDTLSITHWFQTSFCLRTFNTNQSSLVNELWAFQSKISFLRLFNSDAF